MHQVHSYKRLDLLLLLFKAPRSTIFIGQQHKNNGELEKHLVVMTFIL